MKKRSVLIIGAGNQGSLAHGLTSEDESKTISFAKAFSEHPDFYITGFVDIDIQKALKAARMWEGYVYGSISNAFNLSKMETYGPIDVAVVATSDDAHFEPLKQLAEYPLKLVIAEKPLCADLRQAREIVALYREKGIPLAVNYTRRFIPELQELKRRYEAGEFGELKEYSIAFNRGLLHTGSHAVDFMNWFFNGEENDCLVVNEIKGLEYRLWQIQIFFEHYHWCEERIGDQPVPSYADHHMRYVAENAHNFLEGRESLKCTGEDSLKALEICFELMGAKK